MKHKNIPVFIPHLGCPNDCVFCNQRTISGTAEFREPDVKDIIERALSTLGPGDDAEIAFFGGSFTGIDRDLMIRLLTLADTYVADGRVSSVRCSTRPDYIDGEILDILASHSVKTVELGIQSMNARVLEICRRGHTPEDSGRACEMLTRRGFSLVGQMMTGLPGSSSEDEVLTAEKICSMGASAARVYPTVVFRGTKLAQMAQSGQYEPLTDDEAAERTAQVLRVFDKHGVPVIRVGLCSSENLSSPEEVYGGASHPAVGEMAMSRLFLEYMTAAADELIASGKRGATLLIGVPQGAVSKAAGQHRSNTGALTERYAPYGIKHVKYSEDRSLAGYRITADII